MLASVMAFAALALLLALGAVLVLPRHTPSRADSTRTDARTLASAAEMSAAEHPDGPCPGVEVLRKQGFLNEATRITDYWGRPFVIDCGSGSDLRVRSAGPDGRFGTVDDVE